MRPAIAIAALLLWPAAAAAAGFEEGVDAYLRGEYARALAEWLPLAEGQRLGHVCLRRVGCGKRCKQPSGDLPL